MEKKSENTEKSATKPKAAKPSELKGLEMEYSALRAEISQRIDLRQQLNSASLTLTGVFLGVSLANESVGTVALVYPPIAAMLALSWMQNDLRIAEIAVYIRENIEPKIPGLGWETRINKQRQAPKKDSASFRFVVLSHGGIFLITQLLAIGAGLFRFSRTPVEWAFLGVDVLSIAVLIWIIRKIWKRQ
jgi:hypothetical protein